MRAGVIAVVCAVVTGCASPGTDVAVDGGLLTGGAAIRVAAPPAVVPAWASWSACLAEQRSTRGGDECVCAVAFPRLAVLPDFDHCFEASAPPSAPPDAPAPSAPPSAPPILDALKRELREAEGFVGGDPGHIGFGHRLPLSISDAEALLDVAARRALADAAIVVDCWPRVDPVRRIVLASMGYQHGRDGLADYQAMLGAVCAGDHGRAADEMLDSLWGTVQAPTRARRLADAMRTGTL